MTYTTPNLQAALAAIDAANRASRRQYAENMPVDALLKYLTSDGFALPIQRAARWCVADQSNEASTWFLLREIMVQLRRRFNKQYSYTIHVASTTAHHNAFRAVARLHMEQRK